jgi:Holliday junction resolvase-like predicted endonuclease
LSTTPKLQKFPYIVDAEYLCFDTTEQQIQLKAGQGDLLLTNGENEFVALEIKSSYLFYDGSDRIYVAKTSKLIEQVQVYTAYQKQKRPNCKIHGCGVTEQKLYWIDADGTFEEYWWSPGPSTISPSSRSSSKASESKTNDLDISELPDTLQDLHALFMEESISKCYQELIDTDMCNRLTYISKCKQKRITVCKEHISQEEINKIIDNYRHHKCRNGHIIMFGMSRPTIVAW